MDRTKLAADFTQGYIEALLFSSTVEINGETVNADQVEYVSTAAIGSCTADCYAFLSKHKPLVKQAARIKGYSASQAGHDFALTRNGHGAGFWDREVLPQELRDALTAASQAFGEVSAYVNDAGEVELTNA